MGCFLDRVRFVFGKDEKFPDPKLSFTVVMAGFGPDCEYLMLGGSRLC